MKITKLLKRKTKTTPRKLERKASNQDMKKTKGFSKISVIFHDFFTDFEKKTDRFAVCS